MTFHAGSPQRQRKAYHHADCIDDTKLAAGHEAIGPPNHLDLCCLICVCCEGLSLGAAPEHTEAGWAPDLWH